MRPPRLLLVVLAALAAVGCTRRAVEGLPPGVGVEDLPESESWNARLRTSADGLPQLEIEAPYLAQFARDTPYVYLGPPPGDTASAPVQIRLFDEGAPRGSVRAREVRLYDDGARVEADGEVWATVSGRDGAQIEAQRLTVEADTITAIGRVRAEIQGEPSARVQAARLRVAPGGAFTASGGAVVELGGQANATVRARTVSGSDGRYTATGGVRVLASGGRTLEAERVVWSESAGRFSAPGAFAFDGPGERVRGVGLSASADLSRYSFRRATGEIEVRE
ncbi:hypothetical protein [Rubrivirga marina]|uniref:LPS export ABC transporter periplasmic protein LptC n=1 Tax=Rubrivirga marina TaxID=1196024 RepID=A0A271J304_9BACT|nr:hypothetical protein [Rubrivirga marina]PAP77872.1 hypothetical protein BSZ37_16205 [Rubrivirga marina]